MKKTIKVTTKNTYTACPNEVNHPKKKGDKYTSFTIEDDRDRNYCPICGERLVVKINKMTFYDNVCDKCGTHQYPNEIYCVSCGEKF
jgi:NADH pyrophosphatase NudC (nudix superfamily)